METFPSYFMILWIVVSVMIVAVGIFLGVKWLRERPRQPVQDPQPQPQPSLAEIFADQILAGKFSEGLLKEYYSSARGKCTNCHGKPVRWTPARAQEHLERPRLVEAINNQELCAPCIVVLAKTAIGLEVHSIKPDRVTDQSDQDPVPAQPASPQKEKPSTGKRVGAWIVRSIVLVARLLPSIPFGWIGITLVFTAIAIDPWIHDSFPTLIFLIGLILLPISLVQRAIRKGKFGGVMAVILTISAVLMVLRLGSYLMTLLGLW